jgi:hypothetical protein
MVAVGTKVPVEDRVALLAAVLAGDDAVLAGDEEPHAANEAVVRAMSAETATRLQGWREPRRTATRSNTIAPLLGGDSESYLFRTGPAPEYPSARRRATAVCALPLPGPWESFKRPILFGTEFYYVEWFRVKTLHQQLGDDPTQSSFTPRRSGQASKRSYPKSKKADRL